MIAHVLVYLKNLGLDFVDQVFGLLKFLMSSVELFVVSFSFKLVLVILFHNSFVDGVADSVPFELLLESEFLSHGEADNLEVVLLEEDVNNIISLIVELGLGLVQSHWHGSIVSLISLANLDGEGGS